MSDKALDTIHKLMADNKQLNTELDAMKKAMSYESDKDFTERISKFIDKAMKMGVKPKKRKREFSPMGIDVLDKAYGGWATAFFGLTEIAITALLVVFTLVCCCFIYVELFR